MMLYQYTEQSRSVEFEADMCHNNNSTWRTHYNSQSVRQAGRAHSKTVKQNSDMFNTKTQKDSSLTL
jgi:hypothetical protein